MLKLGTEHLKDCDILVQCRGQFFDTSLRTCTETDLKGCSLVQETFKLPKPSLGSNTTFSHRWNWQNSMILQERQQQEKLVRALTGLDSNPGPGPVLFRNAHKERESLRKVATLWTSELYITVQNAMRKGSSVGARAEQLRTELATYMLFLSLRSPTLPRDARNTRCLYRGIRGASSAKLQSDGVLHDKGFIAFSTKMRTASAFGSLVLKLPVESLPKGTPWIWFEHNGVVSLEEGENEVLLPPGMLKLTDHPNVVRLDKYTEYATIRYVPDYSNFNKALTKGALRREGSV